MVKAVFDELGSAEPPQPLHRSASPTTSRTARCPSIASSTSSPRHAPAPSSSASAPTAPWAPTRTRSRSSASRRRTTCRATTSTTRRSPARSPSRTCASAPARSGPRISSATPASSPAISSSFSTATTCSTTPPRARCSCSMRRYPPSEVWDRLPREVQEQIVAKRLQLWVIDAYRGRAQRRARRSHQRDHADLLLRHLGRPAARGSDRPHQGRDREDLRQEGRRRSCGAIWRRSTRRWPQLHHVPVPGARHRHPRPPADRQRPGARLRPARDRRAAGRPGRPAAGQRVSGRRHLADGDGAVGEARHRTARSRSGIRRSASSATSALWSARTPRFAPRSIPPRRSTAAPAAFKSTDYRGNEYKGQRYTIQVAPEDCTGCDLCVVVCPAKDKANPRHKAIDMQPLAPLRETRACELRFLPRPSRGRPHDGPPRRQRAAVPAAALRVLGRLRRLRRDAVHQAA